MIATRWLNIPGWCRQLARDSDRSRGMERTTVSMATSEGTQLNRMQMARALREGADAEIGRTDERIHPTLARNNLSDSGLRHFGASVTLAMLVASTLTGAQITTIRADSRQLTTSARHITGSIPGITGPATGDPVSGHQSTKDTNQEQQIMFGKIASVVTVAVGIATTMASADGPELIIDGGFETAVFGGCTNPCATSCGFSIAPWTRGGFITEDLVRNTTQAP